MVMGFALHTKGWCLYFFFSNDRSRGNSVSMLVCFILESIFKHGLIYFLSYWTSLSSSIKKSDRYGRVFGISFILSGWFRPRSQHNSELLLRQICFNTLPSWILRCCPGNARAAYGSDYDFSSSPKSRDCSSVIL